MRIIKNFPSNWLSKENLKKKKKTDPLHPGRPYPSPRVEKFYNREHFGAFIIIVFYHSSKTVSFLPAIRDCLFHKNATCESPTDASQFFVEGYSGVRSRVLFARLSLCEKVTSDFKITYQVVTYQCEVLPLQNKSLVAGFGGEGWES